MNSQFDLNDQIRYLQLETGTACNHKCIYCPVAYYPRRGGFMPLGMIEKIIYDLNNFPNIERIYLNGYDEPTLNPNLATIIGKLAHLDAKIVLFTNGSFLTPDLIDALAESGARLEIDIHLSAANYRDFVRIHQSKLFDRVMKNLHYLKTSRHLSSFDLRISMQGRDNDLDNRIHSEMLSYFADFPFNVHRWFPNDRGGLLLNVYHQNIYHRILQGCRLDNRTHEWLHVNATGNVILCCQDYHEKYIVGDIKRHTLMEIVASEVRLKYHRWTTGESEAPRDYICRQCVFSISDESIE